LFVSPVGVENEIPDEGRLELDVYPNPLSRGLDFSIESDVEIEQVDVYDALGRLVSSETISPSGKVLRTSSDLPRGVYFVNVRVGGEWGHRKLVVQ